MFKDMRLSKICTHIYLAGILTRECNLCWYRRSPFGVYLQQLGVGHRNAYIFQAAKDVRASQDTLMDVFERIESFFRRLEVYTEVPQTTEMMDTIILIMVEVLSILGVATKEIRQGRMSECFIARTPLITKWCSEKFGKKLIGRTDMDDALKRLDKLTQEEARMAVAQNLKATQAVDERVRGVANTAVAIDNRVAGVDDRVARVDDGVARVDDRVAHVDNNVARVDDNVKGIDARVAIVDDSVKAVDHKVAEVIHGTQLIFSQASEKFNLNPSDGKEVKKVIKQAANDQLRWEIQHWLSPPDPSTSHNFVRKARHSETAVWFFDNSALKEWKAKGSLLWIHGKRMYIESPTSAFHVITC
jgi:archaellum component FlaC